MPRRKNSSLELVWVRILPEDKRRIDQIADKEGKFRYEVVGEALNDRKERDDEN